MVNFTFTADSLWIFQFIYFTNRSIEEFQINISPDLICYNDKLCLILLEKINPIKLINNLTCFYSSDLIKDEKVQNFNIIFGIFSCGIGSNIGYHD